MKMVAVKDVTLVSSTIDRDLRDILAAKLQVDADQLAGVMTLGELGFDSLGLSDLAEAIEDRFGIQVPNRMLPSTLVDLLCRSNEQAEDGQITAEAAD
jgi:acyl carrier protein